jgi:predicted GNAT family N-acyltransferase
VRVARGPAEVRAAQDLRVRVFCEEQGVPRDLELDGSDEGAVHVVAVEGTRILATCRLRDVGGAMKLERMAVDASARGGGVGTRLLLGAEEEARSRGAVEMLLYSQRRVEAFYASHGYRAEGEPFMEAGIDHIAMRKAL